ncbi:unnamed protein product [Closterium sp. NIES-53]
MPKQITPARELNSVRKLGAPGRTTHEAAGPTGSHGNAAAAGAGYHQSLHAVRLHLDQLHRSHHLHHCCRCLHRRCRYLHHPHRHHRSPHSYHHPHLYRHPLRLPHRLHRRPHRPLHHPCPPYPCCCGASHREQTHPRPPRQRGRQQQQNQQRGEGAQGNTPQRKGREGRREKHLQQRYSSQLQ